MNDKEAKHSPTTKIPLQQERGCLIQKDLIANNWAEKLQIDTFLTASRSTKNQLLSHHGFLHGIIINVAYK